MMSTMPCTGIVSCVSAETLRASSVVAVMEFPVWGSEYGEVNVRKVNSRMLNRAPGGPFLARSLARQVPHLQRRCQSFLRREPSEKTEISEKIKNFGAALTSSSALGLRRDHSD